MRRHLCQAFVHHFNMLCMYVKALGLGDRTSNRGIFEPAPVLRSRMLVQYIRIVPWNCHSFALPHTASEQAFDRKVQLLREVAAEATSCERGRFVCMPACDSSQCFSRLLRLCILAPPQLLLHPWSACPHHINCMMTHVAA
jgi:hypothetical protein